MSAPATQAQASVLVALYSAMAEGKQLERQWADGSWREAGVVGPTPSSDLARWRVKPQQRRYWMWTDMMVVTESSQVKDEWERSGIEVIELKEVRREHSY